MEQNNTSKSAIFEYWDKNMPIEIKDNLNFDWGGGNKNGAFHCWNCGKDKRSSNQKNRVDKTRLQRCHIIPKQFGGSNNASNQVLLCADCHKEAPDTRNVNHIWEWISSNKVPFVMPGTYKVQKAFELFKNRKGYEYSDVIKCIPDILEIVKREIKNIGVHGGAFSIESIYYFLCDIEENARKGVYDDISETSTVNIKENE